MPDTSLSEQIIDAYAGREAWWRDHIEAKLCGKFEEDLIWGGVRVFDTLQEIDHRLAKLWTKVENQVEVENIDNSNRLQ